MTKQLHGQRGPMERRRPGASMFHLQLRAPLPPIVGRFLENFRRVRRRPAGGRGVPPEHGPMLLAPAHVKNGGRAIGLHLEWKRGPQPQKVFAEAEARPVLPRMRFFGRAVEIQPWKKLEAHLGVLRRAHPAEDDPLTLHFLRTLAFRPSHHVRQFDVFSAPGVDPSRHQHRRSRQVSLSAHLAFARREPAKPAAFRIEQRAEKRRPIEIRHAKPAQTAIGRDQSTRAPVTDHAMTRNRREGGGWRLGRIHPTLR